MQFLFFWLNMKIVVYKDKLIYYYIVKKLIKGRFYLNFLRGKRRKWKYT